MPSREGYFTTEGTRLFYQITGSGERPLVIPNGFYLRQDFGRVAQGRYLVMFDLRNRGKSDAIIDQAKLTAGVLNDVNDLEALRHFFGFSQMDLLGHSYVGMVAALYAMRYAQRVRRLVQIGPSPPDAARQYPPEPGANDGVAQQVFAEVGEVQKLRSTLEPVAYCQRVWAVLGRLYVVDAKDTARAQWGRCELANERNLMAYWVTHVQPSLARLKLSAEDFASVTAPVLTIHGRKDRSAPFGGGRDWAANLPHARLLPIENGGHAPWIEAPDAVFNAIISFLGED